MQIVAFPSGIGIYGARLIPEFQRTALLRAWKSSLYHDPKTSGSVPPYESLPFTQHERSAIRRGARRRAESREDRAVDASCGPNYPIPVA
jgi:hypothetical protein